MTEQPRPRASRAQREHAASTLSDALSDGQITIREFDERSAAVWKATFSDELEPLTADLAPVAAPGDAVERRKTGSGEAHPDASGLTVSVFGAANRGGDWTIAPNHLSITVLGGNDLDLREAVFTSHETVINCVALFGGIDIIVPENARVVYDGFAIFGSIDGAPRDSSVPDTDAPVIRVRGVVLFGGVDIVRKPKSA
ncbi:DUF1707 SHOCT-like domain-containing protein [Corynebacterium auris]|uniref:DUF1707 SHOCT-like domain-containing protein n=1 Tax=Corynebacterium auris TaxID=44750 RepID=UPI0025B352D3|nr:DUF1707 domain-containing protein [Corynebacterium auris]